MSEELERIGLEAVFILDDFLPKADKYKNSLAAINKATYDATNRMAKAAVSTKEVDDKVAGFAQNLDDTAGTAKLYNAQLRIMYERKEAVKAQTTMMVDALHKEGRSFEEISQAMGVSGGQLIKVFQDQGWSIKEIGDATGLTTQQINQMIAAQNAEAQATSTATSYLNRYLARMALWLTVGATVRGIVNKITETLSENIKRLYENTDEWERLTTAVDGLGLAVTAALVPGHESLGIMDLLATAVEGATLQFALQVSQVEASAKVWADWYMMLGAIVTSLTSGDFAAGMKNVQELLGYDTTGKMGEYQAEILKGIVDAMKLAGEETVDWGKAEEDLAKILQASDEELDRHAKAISLIHGAYDEEAVQVVTDFWNEVEQITREKNAEIAQINAEYAAKVERVRLDGLRRIRELQERARRDERNDEERHQLQMQFSRRRFELSQIQNERMYQARRRRLVGEGDVLAIEELDEQYELQRQAAEENFKLQMEQAEAMYKLQARIQEESMAAQINMLRQAMQEQIAEVEAAKRKEIEEAEAAAAKELEIAEQKRDQDLIDAKDKRNQALADEEEAHKKRLAAIAQQIVEFAQKYNVELEVLGRVVECHWGPHSAMDKAVREYYARMVAYAAQAHAYVNSLMSGLTAGGGYFGGGGRFGINFPVSSGRQADTTGGRSDIYSKPALVPVAEGGRSERVSVQPMYSTGSMAMSLSWTGGPIPVRGEGSLSGANLDQIGSDIAIAISSRMTQAYRQMYTPGG